MIFEIIKCRKKQCEIVNEISWLLVFLPKKEEGRDERNKVEKEELGSLQNVGSQGTALYHEIVRIVTINQNE